MIGDLLYVNDINWDLFTSQRTETIQLRVNLR